VSLEVFKSVCVCKEKNVFCGGDEKIREEGNGRIESTYRFSDPVIQEKKVRGFPWRE